MTTFKIVFTFDVFFIAETTCTADVLLYMCLLAVDFYNKYDNKKWFFLSRLVLKISLYIKNQAVFMSFYYSNIK